MATATESSGPRTNLVPTISSSPLRHTPLEDWAARTSAAVDGHSRNVGTPETPGPAMPGGFFTSPGEAQEHAKALREGSGDGKGVLDGVEVQRAMTNAAQRVKEVLPESVKAMLPSPSQSTLTSEAATPIAAPAPLRTVTTSSAGTDLSTQSQAGSLLPPAPSSLDVDTPRGSTAIDMEPAFTLLSAPPPTLEEDTVSNLSTHVHTGRSNSPDAVAPMDPASTTPSALHLPLPSGTGLGRSAGIAIPAPARTPSPGANGSRFAEDLHVDPPSNPDLLRDSLFFSPSSASSNGNGMVVSPEVMSSPEVQRVREGARAPVNTLASPSAQVPAPAISISEYGGLQAGAPDVLALSGPEGVIPASPSPTSPTSRKGIQKDANSSSEDDGSGGSGVSANGKQKKSRLRRLKEKMHIGSGSSG